MALLKIRATAVALAVAMAVTAPAGAEQAGATAQALADIRAEQLSWQARLAPDLPRLVTNARTAAVATLLAGDDNPQRAAWRARARSEGNNDALVLSLLAWDQALPTGPDRIEADALARLLVVDGDNAFAWMLEHYAAVQAGDSARQERALRQAARASRYQDHMQALEDTLVALLSQLPGTAAERREQQAQAGLGFDDQGFVLARGIAMARAMPGMGLLTGRCRPATVAEVDRSDCAAVNRLLAADDYSMMNRMIGLAHLRELAPEGEERTRVEQAYRRLRWQQSALSIAAWNPPQDPLVRSPEDLARLRRDGEVAALEHALRREGLPLEPPDSWQPEARSSPAPSPTAAPDADARAAEDAQFRDYNARSHAWRRGVADRLAASASQRERLVAAKLYQAERRQAEFAKQPGSNLPPPPNPPVSDAHLATLVRSLQQQAGDDALVLHALAAGDFQDVAPDVADQARQRLRVLEPDNLASWLDGPAAAVGGDAAVLTRAATATRMDSHYDARLAAYVAVFQAHLPPADLVQPLPGLPEPSAEKLAALEAVSLWLAEPLPAFAPLLAACKPGDAGDGRARLDECQRIGGTLANAGDTLVAVRVGLRLLTDHARDPAEREAAEAARRRFDWQHEHWVALQNRDPLGGMFEELLPAVRTVATSEMQRMRAALEKAGIASDPPPGWQPKRR